MNIPLDKDKIEQYIECSLSKSEDLFNHIHHFTIDVQSLPDNNHNGCHVKAINDTFQYKLLWKEIKQKVIEIVYADNADSKIYDNETLGEMTHNEAVDETTASALRHFEILNNQGKIGEVLLFFLVEKIFNAVRIASKYQITMPTDQAKGSDGIHLSIEDDKYCFYLAEAKFHQDLNGALNEALNGLMFHRQNNKFIEELKFLRETPAIHSKFKKLLFQLSKLDTEEYMIRQVAFIIWKDCNTNDIKDLIEQQLNKYIQNNRFKTSFDTYDFKDEMHFIIFAMPNFDLANKDFSNVFGVNLTTPKDLKK